MPDQLGGYHRFWMSTFAPRYDERSQFEAPSVRDVVREAILKIEATADVQDGSRE
jgi:hypothetical protein